jgi:RNA polymerase sigma-70 factor (ECF subfamily)
LAGLNERDPAMCAAFYERARPVIDRTLSKLLGAHDPEYEDVAQMAMYELVNTLPRFRGECPLDAWLSIITGRMVYRHIRRRRLERRIFSATPGDELLAESQTRPVSLALRQALDRVRSHLARMDDRRVWTFLLHDVYGYDLKEASQITGVSLSAAQSRLVRGRREIHDRIRRDPNLARLLDDLAEEAP